MNRRTVNFYLLTILLSAAGCVAPATRQEIVQRTWPAGEIRNIEVREVDGSVTVDAGSPDRIVMVATVKSNRPKPRNGFFTASVEGSTLSIRRQGSKRRIRFPFFVNDRTSINYVLKVPMSVALDIRTVNGRIVTKGVDGESELTAVNGSIDVDSSGQNELSAKTVNGEVRARFRETFQGAKLKTVNGGVRAVLPPSASFSCDLSQVNGDIEASFPVSIHSTPGKRRVSGEVNGGQYELKIVTINGDIALKNAGVPVPRP
jgi:DUF4097 and DUF4098 domain-containing protein YvlB